jgi:hypothetical protein
MKILVATNESLVYNMLSKAPNAEITAALDTGRIYDAIPNAQLAIVDYQDLVAEPFSVDCIRRLLAHNPIVQCTSSQFMASPDSYLSQIKTASRKVRRLPPKRTIAFTSYSGGTGKTSLALDTALRFANQTQVTCPIPCAFFEFTYGVSALETMLGVSKPSLSELVSQRDLEPQQFQGVSLYPMDHDQVRQLSRESVDQYCRQQVGQHILTVVDSMWPHGFLSSIAGQVDLWIVLTTPRIDAVENAKRLRQELAAEFGEGRAIIAVNQAGGLGTLLPLMGVSRALQFPRTRQTNLLFNGRLGNQVLRYLYGPLWREYERGPRRQLGLRRKKG